MKEYHQLITNGYSSKDIADLLAIFEKQLIEMQFKHKTDETEEVLSKLHKIKGGLSLLLLVEAASEIGKLEKDLKSGLNTEPQAALLTSISTAIKAINYLKEQLNA